MKDFKQIYIGGRWTAPSSDEQGIVTEAATEEIIGRIPMAGASDAARAVDAAKAAFPRWAGLPPEERALWLDRVSDAVASRCEEIGETISREVGTPIEFSRYAQAGLPAVTFANAAKLARSTTRQPEIVGNSEVTREPVGVVACITPWNFPLNQVASKVANALAAGCTVVLKPSEVAPLSAFLLAEILHEIEFPPGVFNLVSGLGPTVGEALASHPNVDLVSFTGSTRAGVRVAELAARDVKRVTLELGGKSAVVILDDADFSLAAKGALASSFMNNGQTCVAQTRMLVSERRSGELIERVVALCESMTVGNPLDPAVAIGPLISSVQRDRVRAYIQAGTAEGAKLVSGGADAPDSTPRGFFVKPTVFAGVTNQMKIGREEIFGPVLSIMAYRDEEEAVNMANDSDYGLGGGVWSSDVAHARAIARRIRTGQIDINGAPFNPLAPFGGVKRSGVGRELGRYGFDEFFEYKSIQLPTA